MFFQLLLSQGKDVDNHPAWAYLPKDCGRTRFGNVSRRIINGEKAKLGQFPWMARLGVENTKGDPFFFCGASLISRYYAISAAHCQQRPDV